MRASATTNDAGSGRKPRAPADSARPNAANQDFWKASDKSFAVAWLCGFVLCGCGSAADSDRLAVHPATGTVIVEGEPAAGVHVVLHPKEGTAAAAAGVFPTGTTDADGVFRLSTYEQDDGAAAGEYAVTIHWYRTPSTGAGKQAGVPGFAPRIDRFRGKYKDPGKSPWSVTITEAENVLKPIEID